MALAVFALLGALWAAGKVTAYCQIIKLWGVEVFDFPFLDTETMLSGARCLRAGIDVYVSNPCDTLGRVYDYSPLWMMIARWPVTMAWGMPVGIAIALTYFGGVALLPPGRTRRHRRAILLGAISSTAVFAVERGNNDLVLFFLAAAAATLACRSRKLRLVGYGCALLAGILKYYPMALMALAARERIGRVILIAAGSIAIVALFSLSTWHDTTRALGLVPTGPYISGFFGSIQIAGALGEALHLPGSAVSALRWTMAIVALGTGIRLGRRPAIAERLGALSMPERAFLLAAGLLMLACFFTAQNIGYRTIHLLLALPALLALRTSGSRLFGAGPGIALALLWYEGWHKALLYAIKPLGKGPGQSADVIAWAVREALWWWVITLLATCVFALLWRSTLLGQRSALWAPADDG